MTRLLLLDALVVQLCGLFAEQFRGLHGATTSRMVDWNAKMAAMENAFAAATKDMKKSNVCVEELKEEAVKVASIMRHYVRRAKHDQLNSEKCLYECEQGWVYYEPTASCYINVRGNFSFNEARNGCEELDANLTSIHSEEESNFINGLNDGGTIYWIGLQKKDGIWHWIDGTPLTYTRWRKGIPEAKSANIAATDFIVPHCSET
uniref:C-type lectin domain-containing protein n=1 Tax=Parascaris univalens TaxID=6257 RepID=A0A915C6F7_PARUN